MRSYLFRVIAAGVLLLTALSFLHSVENEHVELGTIDWLRNYDKALRAARKTDKPVLILFQEVPGCATCRNYGLRVLSHPLLAEAAEELFIPLAVFNNRGGADAKVLDAFGEPSWNNPVVRIIDKREKELTRRLAGDYSPGGFSGALIEALETAGKHVPPYLYTLHSEFAAEGLTETALVSMFCFWQGEVDLGGIKGVIATRSGFMQGREVVEVSYNPDILSYAQLLREAKKHDCADTVFPLNNEQRKIAVRLFGNNRVKENSSFREDNGLKYYLSKSPYRFVPMTLYQQVLVNRAVYSGENPQLYLSAGQIELFEHISATKGKRRKSFIGSEAFATDYVQMLELLP